MGQKTKVLSEQALLLEKIQQQSLAKEKNKIKKWVRKLLSCSLEMNGQIVQEKNRDLNMESQEVLDQVTRSILQDIIKK